MINFLSIEIYKYKISKLVLTLILFNVFIFIFLMLLGLSTGGIAMFPTMEIAIHEINNAIIWPSCILVGGIWSSKILIQEFRDNTIINIFSSGVKRISIISTKVLMIILITFIFSLITTLIQNLLFVFVINPISYYTEENLKVTLLFTSEFTLNSLLNIGLLSFSVLIATLLGMKKYSSSITFLGVVLIAVLWAVQLNFSNINLTVEGIRILLAVVGLVCGLNIIRKTNMVDV